MRLKSDAKYEEELTRGQKNNQSNLVNFHESSRETANLHFHGPLLSKTYKLLDEKSTEQLCLMTLQSDAKFEENLIFGSKNGMRNLVDFNAGGGKSENVHSDVLLLSKVYLV